MAVEVESIPASAPIKKLRKDSTAYKPGDSPHTDIKKETPVEETKAPTTSDLEEKLKGKVVFTLKEMAEIRQRVRELNIDVSKNV